MATGESFERKRVSQVTASFASTLATSASTNASFVRSPLAGHATRTRLLNIDGMRSSSSSSSSGRRDRLHGRANEQC